jgi:glycosyltransferase involved in cell wall biosynthesis
MAKVLDPAVGQKEAERHTVTAGQPANPQSKASLPCIAICTVGELFGGVERHVLGMLRSLQARGINTVFILFYDGELAVVARTQGIEPLILPNRNRSLLTTSRRLAQILKERRIRLVHVHGYKATVYCALAQRWHAFAMVKTEHGLPEPMAGSPIRAWRNRLYHWSDSVATRITGATVCYVTEDLRTYHRQAHSGLPAMVIPNGVENMDRCQFSRPAEIRQEWFNLLVVGRLDMVKGHHLAIQAIATEGVWPELHLYIVGLGPREPELRALAESLGIAHRVHMLGFRRNVYDYIAHCDLLLMPSLHEGLPYTLLEAMALGTPIIASRVGGLAEVMQDEGTGLLVPPGDTEALIHAIVRLHDHPELRRQLGEEAQRLQQARYSLEVMAEHYFSLYRELLLTADWASIKS